MGLQDWGGGGWRSKQHVNYGLRVQNVIFRYFHAIVAQSWPVVNDSPAGRRTWDYVYTRTTEYEYIVQCIVQWTTSITRARSFESPRALWRVSNCSSASKFWGEVFLRFKRLFFQASFFSSPWCCILADISAARMRSHCILEIPVQPDVGLKFSVICDSSCFKLFAEAADIVERGGSYMYNRSELALPFLRR